MLGLCTDTETLHDLAQVDEVQELVHGVIAAQGTGCKTWEEKKTRENVELLSKLPYLTGRLKFKAMSASICLLPPG